MNKIRLTKAHYTGILTVILTILLLGVVTAKAFAAEKKEAISGKVYEFNEDNEYMFSNSKQSTVSNDSKAYGQFFISGKIGKKSTKKGIPSYEVSSGNLKIDYTYDDTLLKAKKESWHLCEDYGTNINGDNIDKHILKGVLILQTSIDRKNWTNVKVLTNAFSKYPTGTNALYTTTDVQLLNGCYYRFIVAYKTEKIINVKNILITTLDDKSYKKYAEVYEFFAYSPSAKEQSNGSEQTYSLGEKTRTQQSDGYSGSVPIDKDDMHYGWDLGQFFVSGYTDKVKTSKGDIVFLKNPGDTVTLWFKLKENINKLNGNEKLMISSDTGGYDRYFETPKMNFGRGTLIVRHTDYNNKVSKPQIYTNYLQANTSLGADTKVKLFEEGDYEIALDYEITADQLIDKTAHYRIFFKYSIRNGNCMVYPMDIITGNELTNCSIVEKGFVLDLAKSRYLQINIKKEVLTKGADGLVEDTRCNGPARDGAKYTEEGIYTITAKNKYTNQITTKKIYVGSNNLLKAHMTSGLSIKEINNLVSEGAKIDKEGVIDLLSNSDAKNISGNSYSKGFMSKFLFAIIIVALVSISVYFILIKRRKIKGADIQVNDMNNMQAEEENASHVTDMNTVTSADIESEPLYEEHDTIHTDVGADANHRTFTDTKEGASEK